MSHQSGLWHHLRTGVVQLLVGLAVGVLAWQAFGRRILAFKYGSLGSSVTCAPDVDRALAEFNSGLRMSAAVGAIVFLVASMLARLWWRRRRAQQQAARS
jgi:hypothetical protein